MRLRGKRVVRGWVLTRHTLAKVQGGSLSMHTSDEDGTTLTFDLHRAEQITQPAQDKEVGLRSVRLVPSSIHI